MKDNKQLQWLNFAKTVAILAVIADHTKGVLYTNTRISEASWFSVSLFILISGITSYMSNLKLELDYVRAYLHSVKKIFVQYLIASAICIVAKNGSFDFLVYLRCLIHFNATLPLYYVILYLQLMLLSRPLFNILHNNSKNKKGYVVEILVFFAVVVISALTTNCTQIMDIYGGGGKVLGGTYLILFYLGMLIARHGVFAEEGLIKSSVIWLIASSAWFFIWKNMGLCRRLLDENVPFGDGFNPPSITFMLFGVATLFAVYGFCKILEKNKICKMFVEIGAWLGKHTLHIFMYHTIILWVFLEPNFNIGNIWIKRVVYLSVVIGASLILEYAIGSCLNFIKQIVKTVK